MLTVRHILVSRPCEYVVIKTVCICWYQDHLHMLVPRPCGICWYQVRVTYAFIKSVWLYYALYEDHVAYVGMKTVWQMRVSRACGICWYQGRVAYTGIKGVWHMLVSRPCDIGICWYQDRVAYAGIKGVWHSVTSSEMIRINVQ